MPLPLIGESRQIGAWLRTTGNELVGRAHPPLSVRLEKRRSIHTAWLRFEDAEIRLAIKKVRHATSEQAGWELIRIYRSVVATNDALAKHVARVLGHSPAGRHVAMDFVPGCNMERLLASDLRPRAGCAPHTIRVLEASARVLATLHAIDAGTVGLPHSGRSIASFLDGMRRTAAGLQARGLLDPQVKRLVRFAAAKAEPILEYAGGSLLLTDAQPKNVLVPIASGVCFIDLDFAAGPCGLGVAFFLVSLDRIALRASWPGAIEVLDEWKRSFVRAYLKASGNSVAQQVAFFYPWMLVQIMSDHLKRRSFFSWPLAARYRGLLRAMSRHSSWLSEAGM